MESTSKHIVYIAQYEDDEGIEAPAFHPRPGWTDLDTAKAALVEMAEQYWEHAVGEDHPFPGAKWNKDDPQQTDALVWSFIIKSDELGLPTATWWLQEVNVQ